MRKTISAVVMIATFTVCAAAQKGPGQNSTPPTPGQPLPGAAPSAPGSNRPPGVMKISGRLITNGRLPQPLVARLEGQSAEPVSYADVAQEGDFDFPVLKLDLSQYYYIVVKVEGYKPVRETLTFDREIVFAPRFTIFLEPDAAVPAGDATAGTVVNAKQRTSKIPDKALDEYKKASKDSSDGNYTKAIEHLERALQLAPDYYEAQNSLGVQYQLTQRFRDAEKAFERAQTLNPLADEPLINLGSLYYQEGQIQSTSRKEEAAAAYQKAVVSLTEAIHKNPSSATAHHYLGAALYKTGSYDQAEPELREALRLDSKLTEVELMLLNVYTRQDRYTEALQQIDSFLGKYPKSTQRGPLETLRQQIETALKPER